ncbi:MAG: substrate-binding domain-containing protein [Bacteroidales bacterium]|nr:substrate-binding domain-containing protein [Bacteroidales bacterium]
MAQQLTIKQIAELSGVSVGTVDRILHNRGRVSPEATAAVQQVLDKHSYKYNLHTSAVAFKKTKKCFDLVISIPASQKGEYWDLIKTGIDRGLQEYGDISIRCNFLFFDQFNSLSCKECFEKIAVMDCSAVVLGTTFVEETRSLCLKLDERGIPYVFVDGHLTGTRPVASFHADQRACGSLLAHLMDSVTPEDSEIAVLLPKRVGTQLSNNSAIRLEAFRDYFIAHGKEQNLLEGHFSTIDSGKAQEDLLSFLAEHPRIKGIAVVISTGYIISDALSSAGIKGLKIGGFDVTEGNARCLGEETLHFLINQHPGRQGFYAVESLLHYLLYGIPDKTLREFLPIDIVFKENLSYWHDEV